MQRPSKFFLPVVLLLILGSCPAWAQFTSSIEGTVTDSTGAAVASATVTLTNEETGIAVTAQTLSSGFYRFASQPAALFSVKTAASGFQTVNQEHIRLQAAEITTLNIKLDVGPAATEMTVSSEPPAIETEQGRVSGLIEETRVHDLPLTGKNFYDLVVLTPGVTGLASGGGQAYAQASGDIFNPEYGINLNANGARSESNTYLIDSALVGSSQRTGVVNINPNVEDVQEVRVAVNNFSTEYGRDGSALVNVITKQGTNNWHGSASWYHTDNALQARNEFQGKVPVFRRNEGLWSVGGPIWKDHTFFFTSMDILRSGVATGRNAAVITPQFMTYMSQNLPNNIATSLVKTYPASVTPVGNFQTAGQVESVDCTKLASPSSPINSGGLGNSYSGPASLGGTPCNLPVTGVGSFATTLPRNGLQWTTRVDHTFNDNKDRIFGSFNRTTLNQVLFGAPFVYPAFNTIEPTYSLHFNMDWTHFAHGIVNEAGFSATRPHGDAQVNHPEVPGITVKGIEGYQTGWGPNTFVQNNFEWRDVASFTRGTHSLKIGGGVTRERADHESSRIFNRPQFTFNNVFDFAADQADFEGFVGFNPKTGARVTHLASEVRTGTAAAFVQDDWKVLSNLTVNMGFRWEDFFNPSDGQGSQAISNIQFPSGITDFQTKIANASLVLGGHLLNHTMNTYSPRLGFAWDPFKKGKMSVRSGVGIFYDRPSDQLYNGDFTNTPLLALAFFSRFGGPLPIFSLGASSTPPYNYVFPAVAPGLDSHNGLLNGRAGVTVADPNLKTAHMTNWFFGIQDQLSSTWVAEADYIGSAGRHLYSSYDVNRFNGDLIQHLGKYTGLQPGFANITLGQSNENSFYEGATLSLKKRAGHGVVFDAGYTFGKAIDQASKLDAPQFPDVLNGKENRGLADFDIRHRIAFTTVWTLPNPDNLGFFNKVLSHWELTNITILQSGPPFSVSCTAPFSPVFNSGRTAVIGNTGCDYNADGNNYDLPNTPVFGNTRTGLSRSDYLRGIFKVTDFPAPPLGQEGNLGRNTFHGPGYANTDFSVLKTIRVPWFVGNEGASVQIRAEFFNIFNRVNLTQVNSDMAIPAIFGTSTGAYGARDIQFGLKIAF